jgi:hypothetical protein
MKQLLQQSSGKPLTWFKTMAISGLALSLIIMPELLWHKFTIAVHIIYEGGSFLLEEMLIHGLGMRKFYAQMSVFYLFWGLAVIVLYRFWLRLPSLMQQIKNQLFYYYLQLKYYGIETWQKMSAIQKIKLLAFQFAGISGGFLLLLS